MVEVVVEVGVGVEVIVEVDVEVIVEVEVDVEVVVEVVVEIEIVVGVEVGGSNMTQENIVQAGQQGIQEQRSIIRTAEAALQGRRTKAEAQGGKRKTTRTVYRDAWANFAAFLRFRRGVGKALLERWVHRTYDREEELAFLDSTIQTITPDDVVAYRVAMLNQPGARGVGLSASTVQVRLAALKHLCKIAVRDGDLPFNPAGPEYVDRASPKGVVQHHVITKNDVQSVLNQTAGDVLGYRNYILFKLLAGTGIRRQEASELYVKDMEQTPDGLLLHLRRKGDKEDVILVPKALEDDLVRYVAALALLGPLFPAIRRYPDGQLLVQTAAILPDTITHIVRDLTLDALGTAYGPHRLRHFFATEAWEAGAREEDIQRYLGHEDPKTTRGYLNMKPRRDRSAAEFVKL